MPLGSLGPFTGSREPSKARLRLPDPKVPLLIGGRSGEVGMSRRVSGVTRSLLSLHLFILYLGYLGVVFA